MLEAATGRCGCGQCEFQVQGPPLFRLLCHCTICQRFNKADYADVIVFRANDLELPPANRVNFQTLKSPPAVQRGRCSACQQPAIERFESIPLLKLRMVPSGMLNETTLPPIRFHMFYERRRADIDDDLPKYSGLLRSQWAFLRTLLLSR